MQKGENPTKRYDSKKYRTTRRETQNLNTKHWLRSRRHPEHNLVNRCVSMARSSSLKDSAITTSSAAGG